MYVTIKFKYPILFVEFACIFSSTIPIIIKFIREVVSTMRTDTELGRVSPVARRFYTFIISNDTVMFCIKIEPFDFYHKRKGLWN
jgi:hypothetical protein